MALLAELCAAVINPARVLTNPLKPPRNQHRSSPNSNLNFQNFSGFGHAGRGPAIFAGSDAGESDLLRAEDQASKGVAGIARTREIAPGAGGVARVDADAVAVNAARGFASSLLAWSPTQVAQN